MEIQNELETSRPQPVGMEVLDLGCGPGFHAEELSARGAQVVAFYHGSIFHQARGGSKRMR